MTISELRRASIQITSYLLWNAESLERFHEYAQMFGGRPGGDVYTLVLEDALRARGLTLQQFDQRVKERNGPATK